MEPGNDPQRSRHTARSGVAVVVCAHSAERWHDLLACLDGVLSQDDGPAEVIVVIDHNDQLLDRVRHRSAELAPPAGTTVTVVANASVRGLSGARNTGWNSTACEIVAFLDDDAVPSVSWLRHLVAPFTDPAVVGTSGRVEPSFDTPRPSWFPAELDWVVGCTYRGLPVHGDSVRNPIGASMAFRRAALVAVGGFDARFGRVGRALLTGEETEAAIRIAQRFPGTRIAFADASVVAHRVPAARCSWTYFVRRCWHEGRSKASMQRSSGGAALASERQYLGRTIPRAGFRYLVSSGSDRRRAGGLLAGVGTTAAGYLSGRLTHAVGSRGGPERG